MKTKRITVALAFVIATAAAMGTSVSQVSPNVYGENYLGECVTGDPSSLQVGCTEEGVYICTIHLLATNETVRAYTSYANTFSCAFYLKRW